MSAPGRPKGEFRSAQHEGTPVSAREHCLQFDCAGSPLVGIVAQPALPARVGVVIVVGGPQYRVGSHRQFTLLARRMAAAGFAALRFDCRGMGDSAGPARDFLSIDEDIGAAIAALRRDQPTLQKVALWGLCDAASAALLYAHGRAPRDLGGLCLLNPWVRSAQSQATAQVKHYYLQRLMAPAFWRKLARGEVGLGRLGELAGNLSRMLVGRRHSAAAGSHLGFQQQMARAWQRVECPLLLILSGRDLTAKEFTDTLASDPAWRGALTRKALTRVDLPDADHTFSDPAMQLAVEQATLDWLNVLAEAEASAGAWPPRAAGSGA